MKDIIDKVTEAVKSIKHYGDDMDDAHWGRQAGVLLTGNEALRLIAFYQYYGNKKVPAFQVFDHQTQEKVFVQAPGMMEAMAEYLSTSNPSISIDYFRNHGVSDVTDLRTDNKYRIQAL